MKKLFRYLSLLVGNILLLPAILAYSFPAVIINRIPYISSFFSLIEKQFSECFFFIDNSHTLFINILYITGFVILLYSDVMHDRRYNSGSCNLAMISFYLSGLLVFIIRFIFYIQHGIESGITLTWSIKLIVHFLFSQLIFFGLKDEIEIYE